MGFSSRGSESGFQMIPGICKGLEYVRQIPDICLTYDTIRIPDVPDPAEESQIFFSSQPQVTQ